MAVDRLTPKPTLRWTFGAVAIILALGLLWLALDGDRGGALGASATLASMETPAETSNTSAESDRLLLRPWERSLTPSSSAGGAREESTAASSDNLTVVVLAGAGALALAGLALFLARKPGPCSLRVARGKQHRPIGVIRCASPF